MKDDAFEISRQQDLAAGSIKLPQPTLSWTQWKRDLQPEMMDDPEVPISDHRPALDGLARLNRISGVAKRMFREVKRMSKSFGRREIRLLDVASGAGDVPIRWMQWAKDLGMELRVTTLDISSFAIEEQQRRAHQTGIALESIQFDCLSGTLPQGFDLLTNSLFMHHLDDSKVVSLLKSMNAASRHGMIVCDLQRSRLNATAVGVAAHLLSRSPIVHHDSVGSVRGAFTRSEFSILAEAAIGRPMNLSSAFPCRFMATHTKGSQ